MDFISRRAVTSTPRVFDLHTALRLAEHAVAAYLPPDDYRRAVRDAGFVDGVLIQDGPAQCGICWSTSAVVVAPRGSNEPRDWIGNLLSVFRQEWRPYLPAGARLGLGFGQQARRIAPLVRETLACHPASPTILLASHSLGAAQGPAVVAYLASNGIQVTAAYLFEPPRPGNEAFADWYDERFTRDATPTFSVMNVEEGEVDLVTRVPFKRHGARHVGDAVILTDGGVIAGWDAWQAYREAHPVGTLAGWRVLSRTSAAVQAHLGGRLLAKLRQLASLVARTNSLGAAVL